jgi:TM2 domain-containing membrane protein YozV
MEGENKKKSVGTAQLLSFLIPGLGQIYCGKMGRGVAIIAAQFIQGFLGAFIYVTFVSAFVVWIWNVIDARHVAEDVNKEIDIREKIMQEEEVNQKEKEAKKKEEEAKTLKSEEFVLSLKKQYSLMKNDILSVDEFNMRKNAQIDELLVKKPDNSAEDFLYFLVPLKDEGALTSDDFKKIKDMILK